MKTIISLIFTLVACVAGADSSITSKQYVDAALDTLQPQVPAKNTDTVLTHTGTAGEIGEKKIYNAGNSYNAQIDALVSAETFNTALQNALASEFVCTEWQGDVHDNAHCLLYQVRTAPQNQILPAGFIPVEYLQGNASGTIDTGVIFNSGILKYSIDINTTGLSIFEQDVIGNFTGSSSKNGFVGGVACGRAGMVCTSTTTGVFNYVAPVNLHNHISNNQWHTITTEFANNTMTFNVDSKTQSGVRTSY